MSSLAILIVMISAVMHASWNTLARRTDEPYAFFFTLNLIASVLWLPVALAAGWSDPPSGSDLLLVAVSGSLQVLYFVTLSAAYRHGGITLVYPIARGTGVALVPLVAMVLFDERPTPAGWIGIAATLVGIVLLGTTNVLGSDLERSDGKRAAVAFAFGTGIVIATYSLFDNFGVEAVNPVVYGYGLIATSVAIQAPFVILRRRGVVRRQLTENLRASTAGAVLVMGAYMLVLIALTSSNVSYVVPLRETSIVFALLLGVAVLREAVSPLRIGTAGVIAAGAMCIAIGG